MKSTTFCLVLGLAVSSGFVVHVVKNQLAPEAKREFVCYTHDKLTERHVGVSGAYRTDTMFRISYVEGNFVYYTPKPGESCAVEEIR